MPVPGLDAAKCEVRNLKAARKGVHTIPLRLATRPPDGPTETQVSARGTLPRDEAAALRSINAILGKQGDDVLRAEQVYLLYPEAGNTNYIGDRYMFLGESTLRNVAAAAEAGFAFMNSHRTGDISTPSELPYGRTFAGRYEKFKDRSGSTFSRALLGVYMLRDLKPNGANGPTTDDLYRGIDGGTIFDVSLGLTCDGWCQCDICGNDLDDYDPETFKYLCPHIPGTTRRMTADEVAAQESKGVPGGVATFTLQESSPGEISAVFDGAVPGVGFAKARAFARHGRLSESTRSSLFDAYRPFWAAGDLRFFPEYARLEGFAEPARSSPVMSRFMNIFRLWDAAGQPKLSKSDLELLSADDEDDEVPPDVPPRFRKFQVGKEPAPAPTPIPAPVPTPTEPAPTFTISQLKPTKVELSDEAKALLAETNAQLEAVTARAEAAEKLAREQQEQREREAEEARRSALATASAAFAKRQIEELHMAIPAERDDLTEMYRLCSEVDRLKLEPLGGVAMLEVFTKLQSHRKPHDLATSKVAAADGTILPPDQLPPGTKVLSNQGQDPDAPPSAERKKHLLSLLPAGQAAIENGLVK